jgi:hypothetical protein
MKVWPSLDTGDDTVRGVCSDCPPSSAVETWGVEECEVCVEWEKSWEGKGEGERTGYKQKMRRKEKINK